MPDTFTMEYVAMALTGLRGKREREKGGKGEKMTSYALLIVCYTKTLSCALQFLPKMDSPSRPLPFAHDPPLSLPQALLPGKAGFNTFYVEVNQCLENH